MNRLQPEIQVVEILSSLRACRKWFLQNDPPDVLFMDIQLGDGMSFELFEEFSISCPVIFTTAFNEYAIKAFKNNGIDYLLKPVDEAELKAAVDKLYRLTPAPGSLDNNLKKLISQLSKKDQPEKVYKEKIIVNIRSGFIPVSISDIACFIRENMNYLITFQSEKYPVDYDSLDELEAILDPKQFFRANRQYIINIKGIQKVNMNENQKLTVFMHALPKTEIDISREKAPLFKKWLDR